jgi:hypothetical protein
LRNDPNELNNLLQGDDHAVPAEIAELRERVLEFQTECKRLRQELGVVPGNRGFVKGWE